MVPTALFGLSPLSGDTAAFAGFRLLKVRSFSPSRAIEVVNRRDGVWLRTVLLNGPRGRIASTAVGRLSPTAWARFLAAVRAGNASAIPDSSGWGLDGDDWWIEFKDQGSSGVRHRWEPAVPEADEGTVRFMQVASAIEWAELLAAE